jgi:hypothetical protein
MPNAEGHLRAVWIVPRRLASAAEGPSGYVECAVSHFD